MAPTRKAKPRRARGADSARRAVLKRTTKETNICVDWTLDGTGRTHIKTPIPFLDHMLDLLGRHGFFDLTIKAVGDTHIDDHHTVEDIGIVLGDALKQALGDKKSIRRFGFASVPLDETLAQVTVDLSGRPYLVYNAQLPNRRIKDFDLYLFQDFFEAFVARGAFNLHINVLYGRNPHHIIEATFKAFARALDQATSLDPRVKGVLSTKGSL
ncbi:MAG: imidazoleglycerol-phosphate dehydratase HisB [Nitrospira sp.]